jgi:acyl-CoA thioesterase-1
MLKDVGTDPRLMQKDGIHPTVEAQPMILNNVWPYLKPLL